MRALARGAARRPVLVVLLWLIAIAVIQTTALSAGSQYRNEFGLDGTDSQAALDLLDERFPAAAGDADTLAWSVDVSQSATSDEVMSQITPVLDDIASLDGVLGVRSPLQPEGAGQVSADGHTAYAVVQYDSSALEVPRATLEELVDAVETADRAPDLAVGVGGQGVAQLSAPEIGVTELLGVVFAALVLFLMFRSVTAMLLPIISAVAALGVGTGLLSLMTHVMSIGDAAPTIGVLIGLGVGIDYALFIVNRHRLSLLAGVDVRSAIVEAMDTSGRAVVFAGATVCIALFGLFVPQIEFLYGLAVGASIAVAATVLAAITLLPAILSLLGPRVLGRRQRRRVEAAAIGSAPLPPLPESAPAGRWLRWSTLLQRRSVLAALAGVVVLAVIAIPTSQLRLGTADQGNDPAGTTTREAYDMLADGFGPGFNGALVVAVDASADPLTLTPTGASPAGRDSGPATHASAPPQLEQLLGDLRGDPGVSQVVGPVLNQDGTAAIVQVYPKTSPQDEATEQLIERIRDSYAPATASSSELSVHVGGAVATFVDFADEVTAALPLFFSFVIGLSFLLLVIAFRSLLVPALGAVMNLLSAAAAFGVVVAVFQWGWLADLVGVGGGGPIEPFIPVILFAILFGLSMDYQVFLVSRISEEWHRTGNNRVAVRLGLSETGKVIAAAASIMIFVFGAFVTGDARIIKLVGLGLAAAVLLDAFVIRLIVVPALMTRFGRANWWLPTWLDRILPRVSIEGTPRQEHEATEETLTPLST